MTISFAPSETLWDALVVNGRKAAADHAAAGRPPAGRQLPLGRGGASALCSFPGELRGGVMTQVTEHLQARGVPFAPIAHRQACTSVEEARALGIEANEPSAARQVQLQPARTRDMGDFCAGCESAISPGRLGRCGLGRLRRRVAPGGRGPDQDERGIVVQAGADVAEQVVPQAVKQIGSEAVSAGPGQRTEAGLGCRRRARLFGRGSRSHSSNGLGELSAACSRHQEFLRCDARLGSPLPLLRPFGP